MLGYTLVNVVLKCHDQVKKHYFLSQRKVQEGDPPGSTLFALALRPIPLEVGATFPDIIIATYAKMPSLQVSTIRLLY